MSGLWMVSHLLLWIVMVLVLIALVALAREVGLLHRRLPPVGARGGSAGPRVGSRIEPIQLMTLSGSSVHVPHHQKSTLVTFMTPDCSACADLATPLRSVSRRERDVQVVVVAKGEEADAKQFVAQQKLDRLPVATSSELGVAWDVHVTPYTVAIDQHGVVRGKGMTNHLEHLESLLDALAPGEIRVHRSDYLVEPVASNRRMGD